MRAVVGLGHGQIRVGLELGATNWDCQIADGSVGLQGRGPESGIAAASKRRGSGESGVACRAGCSEQALGDHGVSIAGTVAFGYGEEAQQRCLRQSRWWLLDIWDRRRRLMDEHGGMVNREHGLGSSSASAEEVMASIGERPEGLSREHGL
ncbi:hypothetical protein M0R45_030177 [Rubus argutus]|uniref:MHC class I antigen n=1 Tax=Rubus argutus TaxID=59490 RepID=A0AAW1WE99_RUBAR